MFSANSDAGSELEQLSFSSGDVARIARVSLRQLQWWDERDTISPHRKNKRRVYDLRGVLEIMTVATLRRKGLSLQKVRRILRPLRRALEENDGWMGGSRLWLLTDGKAAYVEDHPERILERLAEARRPMHLVYLTEQMKRITAEEGPRARRRRQLRLF